MTPSQQPKHPWTTSGPFGGVQLPMWARVLMMVGVFPGMVVWLVWMLTQSVAVSIKELNNTITIHAAASTAMDKKIDQELDNHDKTNSLLRQICVMMATTTQERKDCSR